jgi:hypothetical protein
VGQQAGSVTVGTAGVLVDRDEVASGKYAHPILLRPATMGAVTTAQTSVGQWIQTAR